MHKFHDFFERMKPKLSELMGTWMHVQKVEISAEGKDGCR
jgi:hypothetical protein